MKFYHLNNLHIPNIYFNNYIAKYLSFYDVIINYNIGNVIYIILYKLRLNLSCTGQAHTANKKHNFRF